MSVPKTRVEILSRSPIIAVVDDDLGIREALGDLVRSLGYQSRLFASAEDFLDFKPRSTIDLMVVDVKMAGKSGLELQRELNADGTCPAHVFLTSYRDERTRAAAFAGGALAFMGKPVDPAALISVITEAVHKC